MPPEHRTGPSYMRGGVVACSKRRHASVRRGTPYGRRRHRHLEEGNGRVGSTRSGCSCGFGPDVAPRCPSGLTDTTGWRGPLVKANPCKVKGLDPVVNRSRVRRDGGPGGSNATGASYRALIHAGWCCGMSEEAARVSGLWPPSRTAMKRW